MTRELERLGKCRSRWSSENGKGAKYLQGHPAIEMEPTWRHNPMLHTTYRTRACYYEQRRNMPRPPALTEGDRNVATKLKWAQTNGQTQLRQMKNQIQMDASTRVAMRTQLTSNDETGNWELPQLRDNGGLTLVSNNQAKKKTQVKKISRWPLAIRHQMRFIQENPQHRGGHASNI